MMNWLNVLSIQAQMDALDAGRMSVWFPVFWIIVGVVIGATVHLFVQLWLNKRWRRRELPKMYRQGYAEGYTAATERKTVTVNPMTFRKGTKR